MLNRVARTALVPSHRYVCLSCRLQSRDGRIERRFQHAGPPSKTKHDSKSTVPVKKESGASGAPLRFRDIIRDLFLRKTSDHAQETPGKKGAPPRSEKSDQSDRLPKPSQPEGRNDDTQAKQKLLQQKFATKRREQMLKHLKTEDQKASQAVRNLPTYKNKQEQNAKNALPKKGGNLTKRPNRATRRAQEKLQMAAAKAGRKTGSHSPEELDEEGVESLLGKDLLTPLADNGTNEASPDTKPGTMQEEASVNPGEAKSEKTLDTSNETAKGTNKSPTHKSSSHSEPTAVEEKPKKGGGTSKEKKPARAKQSAEQALLEKKRKEELAKKLAPSCRKHPVELKVRKFASDKTSTMNEPNKSSAKISDVTGFRSLQNALGQKGLQSKTVIERADAAVLNISPLEVDQPLVPGLAYGLERVLFNPGVYQLQDPRSRVYNFDPYLQKIMPVGEFDFNALKEYITSSKDESLKKIAKENKKRYRGSTSSMTEVLAHFHFLLSQWRPINASMMSKDFPAHLTSFTELQRTPSAIFLRWKDGSYAIDADKQFATANILSMLGKSMEKLLTLDVNDYERYRKSNADGVTEEEQLAPESYHYSTMGDFLMRSQLDAHDPRLPGTGMFDLKTRAVVSIRMDVENYEHGLGYQIKSRQGEWESYEREYYDMIRAAFLKYSMQVRMGRMDGIFVAFHNIERIFGFQYISLPEMDSTIHGQWDTALGDQEFKLSLELLNKTLDRATQKFPETSLRIHFETRDAATPFMYIFAEPVTEEQVAEIQGQNDAKIQEFERNILGLNRAKGSDSHESQEDDGKWKNIQASVQEAMDKDEMSVIESVEDKGSNQEDVDGSETKAKGQKVFEHGPLYANRNRVVADEEVGAAAVDNYVDEDSDDDPSNASDEESEETEINGFQENGEASEEDSQILEGDGPLDDELRIAEESVQESFEGIIALKDEVHDFIQNHDNDVRNTHAGMPPEHNGVEESEDLSTSPTEETMTQSDEGQLDGRSSKGEEKTAYIPPVPGEELPETEYQIEADRPFLDSMDQKRDQENSKGSPSEILAMTLTLRNKVNNQYVYRPEQFTAKDVWSIEYSLVEVPNQQKAKTLYGACKMRRKKKLDTAEEKSDKEFLDKYLAHLRTLSRNGRKWLKEVDARDSQRPAQILGKAIAATNR
ncbi:hypothetical protein ACLMJK_001541 [Lecanora helva]